MNTKKENYYRLIKRLEDAGFTFEEANKLRRIEMTLQRWSELECGNGNNYASWAIVREETWAIEKAAWPQSDKLRWWDGEKWDVRQNRITYGDKSECSNFPPCGAWRDTGSKPYMETHHYSHGNGQDRTTRHAIPDREKGALKRLAKLMESHPDFVSYHQGDPRGCALYIVRKSDLNGSDIHSTYTQGIAVCD